MSESFEYVDKYIIKMINQCLFLWQIVNQNIMNLNKTPSLPIILLEDELLITFRYLKPEQKEQLEIISI